MKPVPTFAATLVAFLVLDGIWLGFVGGPFLRSELGALLRTQPNWAAAGLFYLVYVAALLHLVVRPALAAGGVRAALVNGAVFGGAAYATFDLTNLAVVTGWTWRAAAADWAWGTVATALAALIGHAVAARAASR